MRLFHLYREKKYETEISVKLCFCVLSRGREGVWWNQLTERYKVKYFRKKSNVIILGVPIYDERCQLRGTLFRYFHVLFSKFGEDEGGCTV